MSDLSLQLGIKSDPIQYRYSYEWLFRILAEEGVRHVQVGTFFEIYQLPDAWFRELRVKADDYGIILSSMFTAHRELGGFFCLETGWEQVARRNYERFIQVGALLGARRIGSSAGSVLRDYMGDKPAGIAAYIRHMKELMALAKDAGLECLTIEPMSCLAEPPTLPEENVAMAEALMAHHAAHPKATVPVGYCTDIAHGYADVNRAVRHNHLELLESTLPWLAELHLKNTDELFNSTFGFTASDRARGIVDIPEVVRFLEDRADRLPTRELVGYFEVGGPKLGRDYSDGLLEASLRESLRYLRETFVSGRTAQAAVRDAAPTPILVRPAVSEGPVRIAPSVMCADQCRFLDHVRRIEAAGLDLLHIDIMDGRFTPNLPLGLEVIKQLRRHTDLPFDVHLMVEDNDLFVDLLAPIGVQMVSVHVESSVHLDRTLTRIRDCGIQAGAALNPHTPLDTIGYVLDRLDFVMLMTVNPGYAGQQLVPSGLRKIADCRAFLERHGAGIPIEVDGNVSFDHIPAMVEAGADILVAGSSSVFHRDASLTENVARTRLAIRRGLDRRAARQAGPGALV